MDFSEYGSYMIRFYKESNEINQDFRENIDGIISNSLSDHDEDLLFEYGWEHKEFSGCKFYEQGKVKKTVLEYKNIHWC